MNLNKLLQTYENPELDNYLRIKELFVQNGFKLPTKFDFEKSYRDQNPLFYFFDFYNNDKVRLVRVGVNTIPIFYHDTLEITSYPSGSNQTLTMHALPNLFPPNKVMSVGNQKSLAAYISMGFDPNDTWFTLKLKESGADRASYEEILDTSNFQNHIQKDILLLKTFYIQKEETIKSILGSKTLSLHDFNLDNLLYLKILYHEQIPHMATQYESVKTNRERELFLKSLINQSIKKGKKLERQYLYTYKLLKSRKILSKIKDFTLFKMG